MKRLGLAALAWFVSLRFVFPGYFDPLVPHHNDFYFPPGLRFDGHTLWERLAWPRPLGFVALDWLGRLGLEGYLAVLVFVSLLSAALTVRLADRALGRRVAWTVALAYFVLLFAHPDFYVNYLHDALATLSYLYLVLAMNAWYVGRTPSSAAGPPAGLGGVRGPRAVQGDRPTFQTLIPSRDHEGAVGRYLHWAAVCIALVALMAFTKETYLPAAICFFAAQVLLCKGSRRKIAAGVLAGSILLSFAGVFYNAVAAAHLPAFRGEGAAVYHVSLAPASVAHCFFFYFGRLFHPAVLVLVIGSIVLLRREREHIATAAALLVAGLSALLPHAALPNHLDAMYAWTAAPLAFAPLLFAAPPEWRSRRSIAIAACAFALAGIAMATSRSRYQTHAWTIAQERTNRNILDSRSALKRAGTGKILVSGLKMPFHPFYSGIYIRSEFGPGREWTVIVPRDGVEKAEGPVTLRLAEHVQPAAFDHAFGYDDDGRLRYEWNREQLARTQPDRVLLPALNPALDEVARDPKGWHGLLRAGVIYWEWGRLDKSAEALRLSAERDGYRNPYPLFYLGQVREAERAYAEARSYYEKAVALDAQPPNPAFRDALARVAASR